VAPAAVGAAGWAADVVGFAVLHASAGSSWRWAAQTASRPSCWGSSLTIVVVPCVHHLRGFLER
jgi:hypothetical protein